MPPKFDAETGLATPPFLTMVIRRSNLAKSGSGAIKLSVPNRRFYYEKLLRLQPRNSVQGPRCTRGLCIVRTEKAITAWRSVQAWDQADRATLRERPASPEYEMPHGTVFAAKTVRMSPFDY